MKPENDHVADYWLQFYHDDSVGLCSLCGNSGLLRTNAPRVGERETYCVCPNGQRLRSVQWLKPELTGSQPV